VAANTTRSFYCPQELSVEVVAAVMGLVGSDVPESEIEAWTEMERLVSYDWAIRCHLRAADNPTRLRDKPNFVTKAERRGVTVKGDGVTFERGKGGDTRLSSRQGLTMNPIVENMPPNTRGIILANYRLACPAGFTVVAMANTGTDMLPLHEDSTECKHGFRAPDRTWIGEWEPS
jgi:hypothetical protein